MMKNKNYQKTFFWVVILICLVLSAGHISPTSATNTSDLIINEFMAANGAGLTDEDGEYSDWIEIYNRSNATLNLAGWGLTDDPNQPQKWLFPDMNLPGHGYLVVFASGKDRRQPGAALHANFKLKRSGDFLALSNVLENQLMDVLTPQFPEQLQDVSYGRYGDGLAYGYLTLPTPGGPNDETHFWAGIVAPVEFSAKRGFYDKPITIGLTTATPGATIYYTTDGTEPSQSNGQPFDAPISVKTTTLLRAVAFRQGFLPSAVDTQSYIFLDNIVAQPANPPGFPASWGAHLSSDAAGKTGVAPVAADYEMDPAVVNDPRYRDTFKEDLKSLPTLSLVMAGQSFADLYTHPEETGSDWERPVSVELVYPAGDQPGFQINAGIRLQADPASSRPDAKHSFRLLFKREYGPAMLDYPLFPESPEDEFDTLVLQAADRHDPTSYTRDAWLHDSQIAMSGLGSSTIFVHLYLNGLYWGVYNLVEKPDASFMSVYFGGKKEDWLVASQDGLVGQDADDQTDRLSYLFTLLNLAGHFDNDSTPSKNSADLYAEATSYLDSAQFSDYMILSWYSQLLDWPENNWRLLIHQPEPVGSGQFLIWNQPDIAAKALDQLDTPQFNLVNPIFETWLQNPDFRMQLADHLYKRLANNGVLTDAQAQARWMALNQTLEQAIIGESARWGDAGQEPLFTQDVWHKAAKSAEARMKGQATRVIAWARQKGYYPKIDPPLFNQEGGLVEAGFSLSMTLPPNATKDSLIYYTTDGSDPRLPVTGEPGFSAVVYTAPVVLSYNTPIKARMLVGDTWSALHEANFSVMEQDNVLRVTEVMYNPAGGDDYEFLELKNVGSEAVDLADVSIDEGVSFIFAPNAPPLEPDKFAVLVSNPTAFAERYPDVAISGVYDGHLSNKGEKILITDANGETLVEFSYNDGDGWPLSPDGRGDSLVPAVPDGDPNDPQTWRASTNLNGSPGTDEPSDGTNSQKS